MHYVILILENNTYYYEEVVGQKMGMFVIRRRLYVAFHVCIRIE